MRVESMKYDQRPVPVIPSQKQVTTTHNARNAAHMSMYVRYTVKTEKI
jgi:hypothetical protein